MGLTWLVEEGCRLYSTSHSQLSQRIWQMGGAQLAAAFLAGNCRSQWMASGLGTRLVLAATLHLFLQKPSWLHLLCLASFGNDHHSRLDASAQHAGLQQNFCGRSSSLRYAGGVILILWSSAWF